MLNNKFYIGLMVVKGKIFQGRHDPLVSVEVFKKVQKVLEQRNKPKKQKNQYKFLHQFKCALCGRSLRAMTAKKRYRYYSCRKKGCSMKTVLEDRAEEQLLKHIGELCFSDEDVSKMLDIIKESRASMVVTIKEKERVLRLQLDNVNSKLSNLIDLQLDNKLPADVLTQKSNDLLVQKKTLESQLADLTFPNDSGINGLEELVKLLKNPVHAYKVANHENKALLIDKMMTNITFGPDSFNFEWQTPFNLIAKRKNPPN